MIHRQKYTDMHYQINVPITNLGCCINCRIFCTMFKTLSNFGTTHYETHDEKQHD